MFRAMRAILIFSTITLLAANAMAQGPPSGRWWKTPRVIKALNLSGGDIQQLETAYGRSRKQMVAFKNLVKKEQRVLKKMMAKPKLNESAIRKQNRKLENARSDLADAKFSFVIQVRKIIGQQRFQRLVDLKPSR